MPHRVQWFPWVGSRALTTLRVYAAAQGIAHEVDKLSISYKVDTLAAFFDHLKTITQSTASASELAAFAPVRAIQKFDEFLPGDLLNAAYGHDYLDLSEAKRVAQEAFGKSS
jgi:hypothetical protein